MDFVGSPEMFATFVEFHIPLLSYSSNPKLITHFTFLNIVCKTELILIFLYKKIRNAILLTIVHLRILIEQNLSFLLYATDQW